MRSPVVSEGRSIFQDLLFRNRGTYPEGRAEQKPLAEFLGHRVGSGRIFSRLTGADIAPDSIHLRLTDPEIFDYPWLFIQQVGHWRLGRDEVDALREYVRRGGFVVLDDFHGEFEWNVVRDVLLQGDTTASAAQLCSGFSSIAPARPPLKSRKGNTAAGSLPCI